MLVLLTPIPSAPGYYADIHDGEIWSTKSRHGKVAARKLASADLKGYRQVALHLDGRLRSKRVHRLVCEAAWGPCPEGMECRHLNGDRADNRAENLAWGLPADNYRDQIEHGRAARGLSHGQSRLTDDQVADIRRMRQAGMSGPEIAKRFGIRKQTVYQIASGQRWRHIP